MANSATPIPRRRNRGSRGSPFPLTPPAPSSLRRTTSARRHERPVPALPSRRHQGAPPSGRRHVNLGAGRYIKWAPSMRPRAPGPLRRAMHGPSLLAQRRTCLVRDLLRGSGHPDFRQGVIGKKTPRPWWLGESTVGGCGGRIYVQTYNTCPDRPGSSCPA